MSVRRRRALVVASLAFACLLLAGLLFRWDLTVTDSSSGSTKRLRFLGIIPAGFRTTYRAPSFDPKLAHWQVGSPAVFQPALRTGDIALFLLGTNRAAFKLVALEPEKDVVTYEFYLAGTGRWTSARADDGTLRVGEGALSWSSASPDAIYLFCDDYFHKASNSLYSVLYPVSESNAVGFVDRNTQQPIFRRFPWDK